MDFVFFAMRIFLGALAAVMYPLFLISPYVGFILSVQFAIWSVFDGRNVLMPIDYSMFVCMFVIGYMMLCRVPTRIAALCKYYAVDTADMIKKRNAQY